MYKRPFTYKILSISGKKYSTGYSTLMKFEEKIYQEINK